MLERTAVSVLAFRMGFAKSSAFQLCRFHLMGQVSRFPSYINDNRHSLRGQFFLFFPNFSFADGFNGEQAILAGENIRLEIEIYLNEVDKGENVGYITMRLCVAILTFQAVLSSDVVITAHIRYSLQQKALMITTATSHTG